jgi:two-component system phosphate regulon sensor histidine kinase PhoR
VTLHRSRFFWKLYTAYVVLVVVTIAIIGIMVSRTIEHNSFDEIENSLRTRAEFLKTALVGQLNGAHTDLQTLNQRITDLGHRTKTRLTVIAADGVVWADSEEDPAAMDNHGSRPEVLQARSHGAGYATRHSRTLDTAMMYVALPVRKDGAIAGYVRASLPLTSVEQRLSQVRSIVFTGAVIGILIALPLGFLAARRFTGRLAAMTHLAREIADGDYSRRIRAGGNDEIGELAGALNTMAEQSQQRLERIARDRNRLVTIFAGMVEGVIAIDAEERVILMNVVAGQLLGVNPDDSIGQPIRAVTRTSQIPDLLVRALADAKPTTAEVRIVGTRQDRVMEAYASPLQDLGSVTTGAVVVLHDISDLRRLEAVRRDFVANVSHELKTPITAVQGIIETMQSDTEMDEPTRRGFLERVRAQVSRLGTLVSDLLTLSRIESGTIAGPSERPSDLRRAIEETIAEFGPAAQDKNLRLTVDLPDQPVSVNAESEMLGQIIRNLLDNAVKYTPAGGEVTLRLGASESHATIEVSDTGIGIERMHQERIFERFYRVDKARSRELGGTGLGLAIVKHLVRSLSGSISVTSESGAGSTFTVEVPLATESHPLESV